MSEEPLGLVGDPNNPLEYLKEFFSGETSFNPEKLSQAYMKLAEGSEGMTQISYCALAWAVQWGKRERTMLDRIRLLEERIAALESR